MFDKFGEFDSFNEINELAENLLNEGDIESLKVVAKENGIQADFVDLYTHGEIPELCDKLTAALGKIDVEAAELKPKEIMEVYRDWETDRKSTRLNSSHSAKSRMPSSA